MDTPALKLHGGRVVLSGLTGLQRISAVGFIIIAEVCKRLAVYVIIVIY